MIIADTGFFLALANAADHDHQRALEAAQRVREPLITTWPVLTETCHLLLARLGHVALMNFVTSAASSAFSVFQLDRAHFPRIEHLMRQYADLPMDLADASLVVLAEHLGHGRILSTDRRDFRTYRWKSRKPFTNLLG
ncbi:MAG: PIN domain-containing protein [Myxococcaceae bacterium]